MENTEWELLTDIVTTSNAGDEAKLYQIIAGNDLSNKTMATSAVLFTIELVPESVERNKNALIKFAKEVKDDHKGFRGAIRYKLLKSLLDLG